MQGVIHVSRLIDMGFMKSIYIVLMIFEKKNHVCRWNANSFTRYGYAPVFTLYDVSLKSSYFGLVHYNGAQKWMKHSGAKSCIISIG